MAVRPMIKTWWVWLMAVAIGALFALPHVVRVAEVGYAAYSPFTAHSPSAMTYDETFLYGAEANYTLTRGAPAFDDTWEHRAGVYPYSVLPTALEAGLAWGLHSLKLAHMVASFLYPFASALLLMAIFRRAGAESALAGLLALVVLVIAFSPMTLLIDLRTFVHHAQGARWTDTLQAARNPNPAITFVQFSGCLLLLAVALERRSWRWAGAAGVLGGLLFFSYVYYAIAWSVMMALLGAASLLWPHRVSRVVWIAVGKTMVLGAAFLGWEHVAKAQGNYVLRATRIGLYHSHAVVGANLWETVLWGAVTVGCGAVWVRLRRANARADAWMMVLLAAMLGGLTGLDMQVVTGFNLQQVQHFPHMVLQPVGFMMVGVLTALVWPAGRRWRVVAAAGFVVLLGLGTVAQVEAARDTAAMHAVPLAERELFAWLNAKTAVGSVVATDDLALSIVLPVMTHTSVLYADGSRSSANDDELMERFLLAGRLAGASSAEMERRMRAVTWREADVTEASYTSYLYEFSAKYQETRGDRHVSGQLIPGLLQQYAQMDVAAELQRFRVDYVWTEAKQVPPAVTGWVYVQAFSSTEGTLWRLVRA